MRLSWTATVAIAIALAGLIAGCGGGGDDALNVTGTWNYVDLKTAAPDVLMLTQDGTSISGTTIEGESITGSIESRVITLVITVGEHTVTVSGDMTDYGDRFDGTWLNSDGYTGRCVAVRRSPGGPTGMNGVWHSTLAGEEYSNLFRLTQSGTSVSGADFGYADATYSGTLVNGILTLNEMLVGNPAMTFSGMMMEGDNVIIGTWTYPPSATSGRWVLCRYNGYE